MLQQIRNLANKLSGKKEVKKENLPRNQRRQLERIENEAHSNYNSLCQKFIDFLYQTDKITDEIVDGQIKILSNRWIFYCKMKRLKKEAYSAVSDFCQEVYKNNKHLLNNIE